MSTRFLEFEDIRNFRDFGGYAVAGGGSLRERLFYRPAEHSEATSADLADVLALSLAVVVDLSRCVPNL